VADPLVSVIVATRDRATLLAATLEALARQTWSRDRLEIVVADNGSTDATRAVVAAAAGRPDAPRLAYLSVMAPGKSFAVNAALAEAHGDILAFTDDDVRPEPAWIERLAAALAETGAAFVAGRIRPIWEAEPPAWLSSALYGVLAVPDNGDTRRPIASAAGGVMPIGANMAVTAEVIARIGGLRTDLGKLDGTLRTGEDHEFFLRMLASGFRGVYEPTAVVHHWVPRTRLTQDYFRRWMYQNGRDVAHLGDPDGQRAARLLGVPRYLWREAAGHAVRAFPRWRSSNPAARFAAALRLVWFEGYVRRAWSRSGGGAGMAPALHVHAPAAISMPIRQAKPGPHVSVLIATYNREARLDECLEALARQPFAPGDEVIVVDNGSTDGTPSLIDRWSRGFPALLRRVTEPRPGKSHALATGAAEATGAILAFTDDDVLVEPDWLDTIRAAMADPAIALAGGPVAARWERPAPRWLREAADAYGRLAAPLALLNYGPATTDLGPRTLLGANLAVRRDVFVRLGGFASHLGKLRGTLLSGEDHDLCRRVQAAGHRAVYSPAIRVRHWVPAGRMTLRYQLQWFYWSGITNAALDDEHPRAGRRVAGVPLYLARRAARGAWGALANAALLRPRAAVEQAIDVAYAAGYAARSRRRAPSSAAIQPARVSNS
jgi:glucosyl-dolichyl phosphate glucuronosyltransferase